MVYTCGTCWREFPAGWQAREQHCDALDHDYPDYECDTCDWYFNNENQRQRHMNRYSHWDDALHECSVCYNRYRDEDDCKEHEIEDHFFCDECDRFFKDYMSINQHLNSPRHRQMAAQEVVAQPSASQPQQTTSPSTHVDRTAMHQVVRQLDPKGVICKENVPVANPVVYQATQRAWNSYRGEYVCFLCYDGFHTLDGLNQHLKSPRHQQSIYHCPNPACAGRDFTTLAALVSHLESGSCRYDFQSALDGLKQGMRALKL